MPLGGVYALDEQEETSTRFKLMGSCGNEIDVSGKIWSKFS